MGWTSRIGRPCRYITGWGEHGPKLCGAKTQNLMDSLEGMIPICAYHASFSLPLREWPED